MNAPDLFPIKRWHCNRPRCACGEGTPWLCCCDRGEGEACAYYQKNADRLRAARRSYYAAQKAKRP